MVLGAWAGVVAEKSGDMRECGLAGPRRGQGPGGGRTDRTGPRCRERKGDARETTQQLANRAREAEREEGARVKKPAPTDRSQWEASERGRARGREGCH
jgi:hypothetical protein